jgi:hypothetical protein
MKAATRPGSTWLNAVISKNCRAMEGILNFHPILTVTMLKTLGGMKGSSSSPQTLFQKQR